jgi:hypothetical protein|nr:MAG TPA: hypothetical protein [Bacteriophage sp.]
MSSPKNKIDFIIYLCYINLIIKYIRFTPDNYIIVIGLFFMLLNI